MRCGVVHNGRFGDLAHNVERVIFVPAGTGATMVNCLMNDAYIYSVPNFCRSFTDAVYVWFEKNRENENVQSNISRVMQYRDGFSPYITGIRVLA